MRTSIMLVLAAVIATAITTPAAQAEEKSAWSLSRNLSFVSDYYSRGISQSWHKPAVQAGLDIAHESGFYAGLWGSSISPQTYVDSTTEIDIYAGYNGSFAAVEKLGWSAGLIGYLYPGGNWNKCPSCTRSDGVSAVSSQRFDTYEANAALSYDWISAKASVTLTDWFGANRSTGFDSSTKGTTYLELNANYPLPFYDLMLVAHVGMLNVSGRVTPGAYGAIFTAGRGNPDNKDYKIGLSKHFAFANTDGVNVGLYYVGADDTGYWSSRGFGGSSFNGGSGAKDLTDNRWVITLSSTF